MNIPDQIYKYMIDKFGDMLIITDADYNIIDANSKALQVFEKSISEIQALNIKSLLPEDIIQIISKTTLTKDNPRSDFYRTSIPYDGGKLLPVNYRYTFCEIERKNYYYFRFVDLTQQIKIENELYETEARYLIMFDQNIVGMAEIDLDAAKFLRVNDKYCQILGYSKEEMLSLNVKSITHPDDLNAKQQAAQIIKEGKQPQVTFETRYMTKSDEFVWVSMTLAASKVKDSHKPRFFSIISDITPFKKAEAELRSCQEMLKVSQEIGLVANWEHYLDENIAWTTEQGFRMFGYTRPSGEIPIQKITSRIVDWDNIQKYMLQSLAEKGIYRTEQRVKPADGTRERIIISVGKLIKDEKGNPWKLTGVLHDVTDFRRVEAQLTETMEKNLVLANLIEHSSQAMAIGNPDGTIGLHNQAMLDLVGYEEKDVPRLDWAKGLTPPEWQEMEKAKLAELTRTNKPVRYEKEYIRKDGSRVPVELLCEVEKEEDNKVNFFYAFVTDISERKEMQKALLEEHAKNLTLTDFINRSSQPMAIGNSDNTLGFHNQAYMNLIGYEESDIPELNKDPLKATPPEWQEFEKKKLEELIRTNRPVKYEKEIFRKDGSRVAVEYFVDIVRDENNNPKYFYCFASDISERKALQQALADKVADFYNVMSQIDIGAVFLRCLRDENGDPIDYRIIRTNKAFDTLTGYVPDKEIDPLGSEIDENNRPIVWKYYKQVFMDRKPVRFELPSKKLGLNLLVRVYPSEPEIILAFVKDITDVKWEGMPAKEK